MDLKEGKGEERKLLENAIPPTANTNTLKPLSSTTTDGDGDWLDDDDWLLHNFTLEALEMELKKQRECEKETILASLKEKCIDNIKNLISTKIIAIEYVFDIVELYTSSSEKVERSNMLDEMIIGEFMNYFQNKLKFLVIRSPSTSTLHKNKFAIRWHTEETLKMTIEEVKSQSIKFDTFSCYHALLLEDDSKKRYYDELLDRLTVDCIRKYSKFSFTNKHDKIFSYKTAFDAFDNRNLLLKEIDKCKLFEKLLVKLEGKVRIATKDVKLFIINIYNPRHLPDNTITLSHSGTNTATIEYKDISIDHSNLRYSFAKLLNRFSELHDERSRLTNPMNLYEMYQKGGKESIALALESCTNPSNYEECKNRQETLEKLIKKTTDQIWKCYDTKEQQV